MVEADVEPTLPGQLHQSPRGVRADTLPAGLVGADAGLAPGETTADQSSCESGDDAIAKNDVAFNAYNLPGTPSLLSDDGRYIPLATLKTDESLAAFLNAVPLN